MRLRIRFRLGIQIILQIWSHSVSLYLIPTLNDVPEKSERNSEVPIIKCPAACAFPAEPWPVRSLDQPYARAAADAEHAVLTSRCFASAMSKWQVLQARHQNLSPY